MDGAGRHAGCCCLLKPLPYPCWSAQPFAPCMLSPSSFCHAMNGAGRHAGCCCLLRPLRNPYWSVQPFAPCMLSPSAFCHAMNVAGRHAGCCCLLRPLPYPYWSAQPFAPCMLSPSAFCHGWGRQACWVLLPSEAAPIPILGQLNLLPFACSVPLPFTMNEAGRHAGCCRLLRPLQDPYWSAQPFAPCMLRVWRKDNKAVCHCPAAILKLADDFHQDVSS